MAAAPAKRPVPSRQGLPEYLVLVAFLVLAAAGAIALYGDELRGAFGVAPPGRAAVRAP